MITRIAEVDNGSCKLSLMMKFVVVRTVIVLVEWNKPENVLRFKIHNYSVGITYEYQF